MNWVIFIISFLWAIFFINWIKKRKNKSKLYEIYIKKGYEYLKKSDNIKEGNVKIKRIEAALKEFKKAYSICPKKEVKKEIVDLENRKKSLILKFKKDY